jgi:diguanylate cyclase (GGDEF)-like protein
MGNGTPQPAAVDVAPIGYVAAAVATGAVAALGGPAVVGFLAVPAGGCAIGSLISARRRVGSTFAGLQNRLLDPFVPLGVAAVLAVVHALLLGQFAPNDRPIVTDGTLLASAMLLCQGIVSLLSERLRTYAMELAREAAFISAIAAVALWLGVIESTWLDGNIQTRHAVLGLAAAAASLAALIMAARLASALGGPGRWFLAAPCALLVTSLLTIVGEPAKASGLLDRAAGITVAAAILIGAGVSHRGLVGLRTTIGIAPTRIGLLRLAVVTAGVLLVPAVTVARLVAEVEVSVPSLAASTAVLSVAAVGYLAGLARDWAQLERRALHDELTGLPNRRHFTERLAIAVADAVGGGQRPVVMFCDLDRFKVVNDNLGHATGNELLTIVAGRLRETLPEDALAARLGGDEFAILLTDGSRDEALTLAHAIRGRLVEPVAIQGRTVHIDVSIGVAHYPDDGHDPDTLVRAADTAMYSAKDLGRGRAVVHTGALRAEMQSRFDLETDLHHAVDGGQLHLVYQPRVDLRSGEIIGAEALLRWHHPTLGAISPSRFIPIAEETGLIRSVGLFALREACRQVAAWEREGVARLHVSVNLSARQFELDRMADTVAWVLRETGADPTWLELELTESLAHNDIDEVTATLSELATMGIRCSVDDFGTGYSGLSYLGRFPLHALKIDRAFVAAIDDAERDPAAPGQPGSVVSAVISLGHSFGLRVIAEGVETLDQLQFMLDQDCDELQGHLFSPPVDAESFASLLAIERTGVGAGRLAALKAALVLAERERRLAREVDSNVIAMTSRRLRHS